MSAIVANISSSEIALPVCLWQYENPNRLVSLWEMFQRDASRFVWIGSEMQRFYSNFLADSMPDQPVSKQQKTGLLEAMSGILQDCSGMGLSKTGAVLQTVIHDYEGNVGHTQAHLKRSVEYINMALTAELREDVFAQIDPARIRFMKTVEEFAVDPTIFGAKVASNFSMAMGDTREAGLCYAMYRDTACVFHCMRVLEKGLRALAGSLSVPFTVPFDYQQWHTIIESVEAEIRRLEKLPAGPIKAETLRFYSQAATQFFYFKNAWRNHVAHARETYTGDQAKAVLDHMGAFMQFLADGGLHE